MKGGTISGGQILFVQKKIQQETQNFFGQRLDCQQGPRVSNPREIHVFRIAVFFPQSRPFLRNGNPVAKFSRPRNPIIALR